MNAPATPRILRPSDTGPFAARCSAGHVIALKHACGLCPLCPQPRAVAAVKRKAAPAPVCRCDKCLARDGVALEGAPIEGPAFTGFDLASGRPDLSIVSAPPAAKPAKDKKVKLGQPPGMKRCPDCARWLRHEEFPKHSHTKDGHNTYCRPCWNARSLEYQRRAKARKEGRG